MSSQHATEEPLDGTTRATDRAAEAAAAAIVPEISLVEAPSAAPARAARGADGRFMRVVGAAQGEEDGLPSDRFLDREISWLQFNERVLQLAADPNMPLLEPGRDTWRSSPAISTSSSWSASLVSSRSDRDRHRRAERLWPGAPRVLDQISFVAHELLDMQARVFHEQVRPALAEEGITVVRWDELAEEEQGGDSGRSSGVKSSRC